MAEKKKKIVKKATASKPKKVTKATKVSATKKRVSKAKKTTSSKVEKVVSNNDIFVLGPSMDIAHVEKFFIEVKKYLGNTDKRVFDASGVDRITTPCIQLLISIANSCNIEGKEFSVLNPSETFCKAMEDLGLKEELNNWRS